MRPRDGSRKRIGAGREELRTGGEGVITFRMRLLYTQPGIKSWLLLWTWTWWWGHRSWDAPRAPRCHLGRSTPSSGSGTPSCHSSWSGPPQSSPPDTENKPIMWLLQTPNCPDCVELWRSQFGECRLKEKSWEESCCSDLVTKYGSTFIKK